MMKTVINEIFNTSQSVRILKIRSEDEALRYLKALTDVHILDFQILDLKGSNLSNETFLKLSERLLFLKSANLSHCLQIEAESVEKLITEHPALIHLDLTDMQFGLVSGVIEKLPRHKPFLKYLEFEEQYLTDELMTKIKERCPDIRDQMTKK